MIFRSFRTALMALVCVLLPACLSAESGSGRNSFETLNLTYPARFFGLAGAGVALSDDVSSCFINASRLVQIKNFEFSAGGSRQFDDSFSGNVCAAYPMPLGVFGLSLIYFNYGRAELRKGDTEKPDSVYFPKDLIAGISFGASLFRAFSYGINLKYIQENLAPDQTPFAFAVDLNTHFSKVFVPGLQAGFTINNLGIIPAQKFKANPLPLAVIAGFAYSLELKKPFLGLYDIKPVLDTEFNLDPKFRFLGGAEWCWYNLFPQTHFVLRTGFSYSFPRENPDWPGCFRLGAGLEWRRISLDYGTGWLSDLGLIHRISFTFKLQEPAPRRYMQTVTRGKMNKTVHEIDDVMKSPPRTNAPPPFSPSVRTNAPQNPNPDDEFDFEEE